MEIGIYTFAETSHDAGAGWGTSAARRLRDLMEEIELADQVGLDVFGVGEHHRPDYAVSAPAVVPAAAAERTKRMRLTSAVTVLSSDDPVRVFQQFATLDLLSGGSAAGRRPTGRSSRRGAPLVARPYAPRSREGRMASQSQQS
jgi:hypothetical protein